MTMMQPPVGQGLPPMGQAPGGMPPQDPSQVMLAMMQALMQKWSGGAQQIAGEQQGLAQVMQQLLMSGAPTPAQGMAEPTSAGVQGYGMDPSMGDPLAPPVGGMDPSMGGQGGY